MIHFKTPTIEDYAWLQPMLYGAGRPGAEYTFNNMFFWSGYYGGVALVEGCAVQASVRQGQLRCSVPLGPGDWGAALEALLAEARERGLRLSLRGVTADLRPVLEGFAPGHWAYTCYRDAYDYIYTTDELVFLRGKKLQAKRNHCNRFMADHPDWHTECVDAGNLHHCRALAEKWYACHGDSHQLQNERVAIGRAFDHFDALGMDGMLLFGEEEPLAFAMGVRMNETYYDVNFEKGFARIQGAYAMINREFSRYIAETYPEVECINREDDMGEEGLRKAKESYQPTLLLEKCTAVWQDAPVDHLGCCQCREGDAI